MCWLPPSRNARLAAAAVASDRFVIVAQIVCLLKVSVVVLLLDPHAIDTFTLPKSLLSHELTFILAAALVWLVLVRRSRRVVVSPLHYAVALVLLTFALATPFALDRQVALFGADRRYLGFMQMVDAAVFFAAVAYLFRTTRDLVLFAVWIGGITVVVGAYALLQRLALDPFHLPDSTVARPISTLGQPDFLAPYSIIVAVTCIASMLLVPRLRRPRMATPLAALTVLCLYVAYVAGTRSSILAVGGAAAAAVFVAYFWRGWTGRRLAVIVGVFAVAIAALLLSPLASRITPAALEADRTLAGRIEIWGTALRMTQPNILLGVGPDNFAVGYPKFRDSSSVDLNGVDALQNNPHNWLLQAYTSAGLLGAVSMVLLVGLPIPLVIRLARSDQAAALAAVPLYAYLAQGLVNVNDIGIDWILWASLGVIAGGSPGQVIGPSRLSRSDAPRTLGWLASAGLVLACFAFASPALNRLQASEDLGKSQALLDAKRPLEAIAPAAEATRLDSARGHSWGAFGSALAASGAANAAQRGFLDAAEREPWQPLWWRDAAFQAIAQNDERGAIGLLQRAVEADPYDSTSLDLLSRLSFNQGDFERALAYGQRAVHLTPAVVPAYDAPVQAALKLRRYGAATEMLSAGIRATNMPHLRVLLAHVYVDSGDIESAKLEIQAALRVAPNDPEVLGAAKQLEGR